MTDLLRGLPDAARAALAAPPDQEHALLELALAWPGLVDAQARVAGRLRLFVLTVDPLSWLERRSGPAWATVNGAGETFEVVLYIPLEHALDIAGWDGSGVLEVLAALGESAVTIGARCEPLLASGAYPRLAERGETDRLPDDAGVDLPKVRAPLRLGVPAVSLTSGGWEPIGPGVVHDLAQEAFGPVDLDRSPMRLRVRSHSATCPACAGRTFGFPADLEEQRAAMCPAHAREAREVTDGRLDRAATSNLRGWAVLSKACRRLEEARLPWDLRQRLRAALDRGHDGWPGRDADPAAKAAFAEQTRDDAELVIALAEQYEKHPDRFDELLEELGLAADGWLMNIPFRLGSAGLTDLVAQVGDALGRLDPAHARMYASDTAVVLAEAGRAGEALARPRPTSAPGPTTCGPASTSETSTPACPTLGRPRSTIGTRSPWPAPAANSSASTTRMTGSSSSCPANPTARPTCARPAANSPSGSATTAVGPRPAPAPRSRPAPNRHRPRRPRAPSSPRSAARARRWAATTPAHAAAAANPTLLRRPALASPRPTAQDTRGQAGRACLRPSRRYASLRLFRHPLCHPRLKMSARCLRPLGSAFPTPQRRTGPELLGQPMARHLPPPVVASAKLLQLMAFDTVVVHPRLYPLDVVNHSRVARGSFTPWRSRNRT